MDKIHITLVLVLFSPLFFAIIGIFLRYLRLYYTATEETIPVDYVTQNAELLKINKSV